MEYSNYANRIKSLINFDTFEKLPAEHKDVARFFVKKGNMVKAVVTKTKCSQLNNKRFYFPDGVLSLPYGQPSLSEIDNFKSQKGHKIEKYFWQEKEMEKSFKNTPRIELYHQTLTQDSKIVNKKQKSDFKSLYKPKIKKKH